MWGRGPALYKHNYLKIKKLFQAMFRKILLLAIMKKEIFKSGETS
jgi:hypothetical protein